MMRGTFTPSGLRIPQFFAYLQKHVCWADTPVIAVIIVINDDHVDIKVFDADVYLFFNA